MKHLNYTVIIGLLLIVSSCAFHSGTISSTDLSEEYIYEDLAFGVSQTNQFFLLGGLSKDALVLEAKRQLYRSRPLKANECYANYSIDIKTTYIFFYRQTKVTVSADIAYKSSQIDSIRFSKNYISKLNTRFIHGILFEVGDTIVDKNLNRGVIIDMVRNEKFRVLFRTQKDNYRSKKKSVNNIFSTNRSYNGLNPGDSVVYKSQEVEGIIVALGINGFIYEEKDNNTYFSKYINTEANTK